MSNIATFTSDTLSITNDILISIILGFLITIYISHSGINKVVLIALSLYMAIALNSYIFFPVSNFFGLDGSFLLLLVFVVTVFTVLQYSSIGKLIHYSKKTKLINIIFGLAVTGMFLALVIPYISLLDTPYSKFLRQSLFGNEIIQFLWILAPIILLPTLTNSKKK